MPKHETERSKHARHRARLRMDAIAALGGRCQACGYDQNVMALDICRAIRPRRRATTPRAKNHGVGTILHRRIMAGDRDGLELLCCNCNAIRIRSAGRIHHNVRLKVPRPPATAAAHATGRDRRG